MNKREMNRKLKEAVKKIKDEGRKRKVEGKRCKNLEGKEKLEYIRKIKRI